MAGFIFGGETGTTAEDLARRRKVIDALRANSVARMPRDVGEGIFSLGTALVGRYKDKKLDPLEDTERARVSNQFDAVTNGIMGGGQPSYTPARPLGVPEQIGQETMAAIGRPSNAGGYRESLIGTESGGNFGARNNEVGAGGQRGHFGRVQFGHARLQDAMNAGAIPQGTTPEQFMASPELQMAAENWHFADLESKLAPYVGTVVNGQPLDMGALVAMGHLGGAEGARRFVETGGKYNPSDSFGTSLADYAQTHGGQGGAPGGGQPRAQIVSQLAELMQNPYLSDTQKIIAQQLLGEQMQAPDPMAAIELERAQLELEQLRNPVAKPADLPSSVQEYQFYAAQATANGETPMPYADFLVADEKAGVPQASPDLGKLSTDFGYVSGPDGRPIIDPTTGLPTAAAVPGSPADIEARAAAEAAAAASANAATRTNTAANVVTQTTGAIRDMLDKGGMFDLPEVGVVGSAISGMNQEAADMAGRLDTLKGMVAFDRLEAMKNASATGASGLGQVTEREIALLAAQLGALDQKLSPALLRETLDNIDATFAKMSPEAQAFLLGQEDALPGGVSAPPANDDAEFLRSLGLEP